MKTDNISDSAFVLSRVNYGETDRILNVLCQRHGKLSVIAKGVRAGKSKLAGGIELFAENELILLKTKGDMHIVTSSRMKNYFGDIAKDIDASSFAYECLKFINKVVPEGSGAEYHKPLLRLLEALEKAEIPLSQIKIWYGLKLLQNLGSLPNFKTDSKGMNLQEGSRFEYDFDAHSFSPIDSGTYMPDHIKMIRHLADSPRPIEIKTTKKELANETENLVSLILKAQL